MGGGSSVDFNRTIQLWRRQSLSEQRTSKCKPLKAQLLIGDAREMRLISMSSQDLGLAAGFVALLAASYMAVGQPLSSELLHSQ